MSVPGRVALPISSSASVQRNHSRHVGQKTAIPGESVIGIGNANDDNSRTKGSTASRAADKQDTGHSGESMASRVTPICDGRHRQSNMSRHAHAFYAAHCPNRRRERPLLSSCSESE